MYEKNQHIADWQSTVGLQLQSVSDSPALEATLLLSAALNKPRSWILAHPEYVLSETAARKLEEWLAQRCQRVPLAYLLGEQEFWSMPLRVTTETLIPRADTEVLVERALKIIAKGQSAEIADLGTGSGAIALAIASERAEAAIIATDLSDTALHVAAQNAKRMQLSNVSFRQGNWCDALPPQRFDLIVSNPPYVEADYPALADELRHEPALALVSGADGLDAIRALSVQLPQYLKPGAHVLIEHGHMQAASVSGILRAQQLEVLATHRDLAGHPRVTEARLTVNPS